MAIKNTPIAWGKLLSKFKDNFFDALFPKECIGCKKEGYIICPECSARTRTEVKFVCLKCGKESFFGKICGQCKNKSALAGLLWASYYGNPIIRDAIYTWKYSLVEEAGGMLGDIFLAYTNKYRVIFETFDRPLVQAVPLNRERLLWRGFNQADILAEKLTGYLGYRKMNILMRNKKTVPQSEVGDGERERNVSGAFAIDPKSAQDINGRTVILVDDIFTSGSTMEECAKILRAAGAKEIWGFVLAKG